MGTGGEAMQVPITGPVRFETIELSSDFYSEGSAVGDVDGDGIDDLIAGPRWYRGPNYELGGVLYDAPTYLPDEYSKFFLTFTDDLNHDGYVDLLVIAGPGGPEGLGQPNADWFENPGPSKLDQDWPKHPLFSGLVSNESPLYANLVGDEAYELIFMTEQMLGFATPGVGPTDPWIFNAISDAVFPTPYVHGLGIGDLNGDGLQDLVEKTGWWEQPTILGQPWIRHEVDFNLGGQGGAQMLVYDIDGDGDGDVVSSLNAHGYGLYWFEQETADSFIPHEILPPTSGGISFSQQHAMAQGDINGDGLLDFVTGKRYCAHPCSAPDPGSDEDAVTYWFELSREGGAHFLPHLIDNQSGIGCNFSIVDLRADGRPAVFSSNKRGTFLHRQY